VHCYVGRPMRHSFWILFALSACHAVPSGDGSPSGRTAQRAGSRQDDATRWRAVSAGSNHTCAIDEYGRLWCWGKNDRGALGDGTMTTRTTPTQVGEESAWTAVSAGFDYTCGIRYYEGGFGTLWCWGPMDGVSSATEPRRIA